MITILYFARLRDALGTAGEQFELPAEVRDTGALRMLLCTRGGDWAQGLGEAGRVLVAVNQELAAWDTPIHDGDEVAFFPPVTGG